MFPAAWVLYTFISKPLKSLISVWDPDRSCKLLPLYIKRFSHFYGYARVNDYAHIYSHARAHWQKTGRQVQLSKWLSYFFTSLFFDPSSTVRLLSATVLSLALPVNHEFMKQSWSSQVNVLWLSYHGNAGSNSQGDAALRILPGPCNHTHTGKMCLCCYCSENMTDYCLPPLLSHLRPVELHSSKKTFYKWAQKTQVASYFTNKLKQEGVLLYWPFKNYRFLTLLSNFC